MSATVTYKGATLTTVENNTATLETAGTWVEDDITITDSTATVVTQEKTVTAGTSATSVTPDTGYDAMTRVTVNPTPSESKTQAAGTSNVTVTPSSGKLLSSVIITPTPSGTKTVTPSTSAQTVNPDSGKLLSKVTVNAIPNLTATRLYSGTANTYTTTSAYKYLIAMCNYWYNGDARSFTYSGTATAVVNNYNTVNDHEHQHVTILRDAAKGVKFTSGNSANAGRMILIVYGFNY